MTGDRKTEPPLRLDMDFSEALERFARTDPKQVAQSIERAKKKKPPGAEAPQRPSDPPKDRKRQPKRR